MSDNLVPIQEYIQTTTRSFQYMSVQEQNIVLYQSVDILVKLFDANQALCDVKVLSLNGDDYQNWGANDNYILNISCTKLGITLQPTDNE